MGEVGLSQVCETVRDLVVKNPVIRTERLSAFYGKLQALKDVSIRIPTRQITTIMGPSGCGKSTLLKTMNRLIELDGGKVLGKVYFNETDIYSDKIDVSWLRRKVGMVFQKPNPLPMSIYDNVAYGLRIQGIRDRSVLDEVVRRNLEIVGLWDEVKDRLKEPALKLSGGQQQRLCIARALAVKPEVLLLDEPTSSLDPASAKRIEKLLTKLKQNYTIVIVTHNVHQAMRLADHAIFLYMGKLIEEGSAKQIFTNPKSKITYAYLNGEFS